MARVRPASATAVLRFGVRGVLVSVAACHPGTPGGDPAAVARQDGDLSGAEIQATAADAGPAAALDTGADPDSAAAGGTDATLPKCKPTRPAAVDLPGCVTATDCPVEPDAQALCLQQTCQYRWGSPFCSADFNPGCDDKNIATQDSCQSGDSPTGGVCVHACLFDPCGGGDCDDGSPLTADLCFAELCGQCANVVVPGACLGDIDCDDSEACTVDTCVFTPAASLGTCTMTPTCCVP